jgi:hypothetical protein
VEGNHGGKGNEARGNWRKDAVLAGTARARAQDKMVHADRRNLTDWWASFRFLRGLCARPCGEEASWTSVAHNLQKIQRQLQTDFTAKVG